MINATPWNLERAVAAICPDIQERAGAHKPDLSESQLWWELSCCLLSSQVSYDLAVAATDTISSSGLLLEPATTAELSEALRVILKERVNLSGRQIVYRFYTSKSTQLAETRGAVCREAGSLSALLASFNDAVEARDWFVEHAPGIGPKQASMFLRNTGITYDLAIIDRHVLKYMQALGISDSGARHISGLTAYQRYEANLREHAGRLGFSVGLMDWAIWIVMRAADGIEQSSEAA